MRTLADLGEFGLIERIRERAGSPSSRDVVLGIGDDAAILRPRAGEDSVVSTDACVEGVHFDWSIQSGRSIGRRALIANLSDLAAMGARPVGFTCALAAPPSLALRRFDAVLKGLLEEAQAWSCPLVGGNLTRASRLHMAITVFGAVPRGRALRRAGLAPGDRIFLTGHLGSSALDRLRAIKGGGSLRHIPVPRLEAGRALGRMKGRRACIDLSDGLGGDLGHLARASGVGVEVDPATLPRTRSFTEGCRRLGFDPLELAVSGGEDYELLFGLDSRLSAAALSRRLNALVTEIGVATRNPGVRGLPTESAWRHW
ncbi:MAG: thiamine-phosphate kinase [bacterium TMED88]|nr:thiamine-phosphate kinase [Deltaproteobacteria bacterium]OUV28520.1 MAG: thiamine-phosphate kinase [bacterium TMED88]